MPDMTKKELQGVSAQPAAGVRFGSYPFFVNAIFLVGLYLGLISLAIYTSFAEFVAPIWFPAGLIVAVVIRSGLKYFSLLLLAGAFESLFFGSLALDHVIFSIVRNGSLAAVAYITYHQFTRRVPQAGDLIEVSAYFAAAGLAAAVFAGYHTLWLNIRPDAWVVQALPLWYAWTGSFAGIMVFLPFVFAIRARRDGVQWNLFQRAEWVLLNSVIVAAAIVAPLLAGRGDVLSHVVLLLPLAMLIIAALRFGMVAAVVGNILLFLVFSIQATLDYGFFGNYSVFDGYLFIVFYGAVSLPLSVLWGQVSDRLRTEKARSQENLLSVRRVLDALPLGLLMRSRSGRNILVNKRWAALAGQSPVELEGDQSSDVLLEFQDERRTLEQKILNQEGSKAASVRVSVSTEDETRDCLLVGTLLEGATPGEESMLGLLFGASELFDFKDDLLVSENRFKTAMESAGLGFWDSDLISKRTYRDEFWYHLLGIPESKWADTDDVWLERVAPEDRLRVLAAFGKRLCKLGDFCEVEYRMRKGDGHMTWVQDRARVVAMGENGEPSRIMGVMQDVTARKNVEVRLDKARESAELANRAKDQFLASISHEIRTPLNAIIGLSSFLMEAKIGEEERGFAKTICSSGNSLLALIEDLLDFSRIEAGKLILEVQDFPVRTLLEDIVKLLQVRAEGQQTVIRLEIDESVPEFGEGDMNRLRQVVTNLIGNAIKFTKDGVVTVRACYFVSEMDLEASARRVLRPRVGFLAGRHYGHLLIRVVDTGIGIAKENQKMIFEAFSQVDSPASRNQSGTGLGLAISQQIVHAMGGGVWVKSEPGRGSEFGFVIRFAEHDKDGGAGGPIEIHENDFRPYISANCPLIKSTRLLCVGFPDDSSEFTGRLRMLGFRPHFIPSHADVSNHILMRGYDAMVVNLIEGEAVGELMHRLSGLPRSMRPRTIVAVIDEKAGFTKDEAALNGFVVALSADAELAEIEAAILSGNG